MRILCEEYGFNFKLTHYEYIHEEFTMEVVQVAGKYIVRLEQSERFNPSSVYYKLFEEVDEIVEFVRNIFTDYGVEEFIL